MVFTVNGSSCKQNTINIGFTNGGTNYVIENYDIFYKIVVIFCVDMLSSRIIY